MNVAGVWTAAAGVAGAAVVGVTTVEVVEAVPVTTSGSPQVNVATTDD